MPNFDEIKQEWEQIKDTPDAIGNTRTLENPLTNTQTADNLGNLQDALPDEEAHYQKQLHLTKLFDKTSRAGAKSKLNGMILANGRKMFAEFHDNYTGTGRFKPQVAPDKVDFKENAPKVDPYPHRVIMFDRCVDCREVVDLNNFHPDMTFIPPGDMLNPIAKAKWAAVDIKPGTLICYLFCMKCPSDAATAVQAIRHDPIKSKFIIGMGPDGKPMTLAQKEAHEYMSKRSAIISDNIFAEIKRHRDLKSNDIFFGNAKID